MTFKYTPHFMGLHTKLALYYESIISYWTKKKKKLNSSVCYNITTYGPFRLKVREVKQSRIHLKLASFQSNLLYSTSLFLPPPQSKRTPKITNLVCVWVPLILLKIENNKNLLFMLKSTVHIPFMSHEPCKRHWTKKKEKNQPNANVESVKRASQTHPQFVYKCCKIVYNSIQQQKKYNNNQP